MTEMGASPIPKNVSALQWIKLRKQRYFFLSYALTITYVFLLAMFFVVTDQYYSDENINRIDTPDITITGDQNIVATDGSTVGPPADAPSKGEADEKSN
jgi:hypothetical protein